MAAALEETPVSYEDLAEIEREFDDVETEIIRQQVQLTTPLYTRRSKTVSQIPNFWPLVLEQAPPDIDQYIQPSDSALLLSSLTSLSVSHFELELQSEDKPSSSSENTSRDPRSVSIRFEFAENEYFENPILEKKFWYRRSKDGWSGLVSEPVAIQWKKDRDLTGGLLDMVVKAWEVSSSSTSSSSGKGSNGNGNKKKQGGELSPEQKALKKKIENTGMGGLSFFAWFGFIGRHVSAEESAEATALERAKRYKRGVDSADNNEDEEEEDEEDEEDDDIGMSLEIFPDGDDLAVAFTEDLWPGAIKYFTQAQEQDALSDADFESDDDEEGQEPAFNSGNEGENGDEDGSENGDGDEESRRPMKKLRSS